MKRERLSRSGVVASAADVADREGIDAVTLTRIARECGVTQPALYRHVQGIDDLWHALAIRGADLLVGRLSLVPVTGSFDEAVSALCDEWRRVAREHPGLMATWDRLPAGDSGFQALLDRIVAVLCDALTGFGLDEQDAAHAARTMLSAVHGFTSLERATDPTAPRDPNESFDQLVSILTGGIRGMPIRSSTT